MWLHLAVQGSTIFTRVKVVKVNSRNSLRNIRKIKEPTHSEKETENRATEFIYFFPPERNF